MRSGLARGARAPYIGAVKIFWFSLGALCVAVGVAGVILPGLPGTVFLLAAAWCFARSSDRAHRWLVGHRWLGPPITDWQAHGVIRRRAKWTASVVMAGAVAVTTAMAVPWWGVCLQAATLACVALFLWTRPETPPRGADPSTESPSAETVPAPTPAGDASAEGSGLSPGSRT
ncbi:YbaN family protein [uncultured Albimonas sp.]|uniref:YbaN family protein n=1 Tax=uncultured Albimonas sp. TaxID=1331701 RepID=UPI0030EF9E2D